MTRLLFSFLLSLACAALAAQSAPCDYAKLMREGRDSLQAKRYQGALKKFNAARTCDRDKSPEVDGAVDAVFRAIEGEKEEALRQKKRAEEARRRAAEAEEKATQEADATKKALAALEIQKARTDSALAKAEKLVNAFYFYGGRFALAYGQINYQNKFYFIDKNGDPVGKLGQYDKAEQFDWTGFAKVRHKGKDYLLDTFGTVYPVAYTIAGLKSDITALDLRGIKLNSFPAEALRYPQLEVLILNGDYGTENNITLPVGIEKLPRLKSLQLASCQLNTLPAEIGQLTNLQSLDLRNNQLSSLPAESALWRMKNLQSLDLRNNKLSRLPAEVGQLKNLQSLNLSVNKLSSLPAEIRGLKSLKELYLRENPFSPAYIEQLRRDMPWCEIEF
jgi:hypothetical protein